MPANDVLEEEYMAYGVIAPYYQEDPAGVTIAVAVLVRLEGPMVHESEIERWVHELDAALLLIFGGDENTPIGITIRATERTGKGIAEALMLNAAVACPAQLQRSTEEEPRRTIATFAKPEGGIDH